MDGILNLHKPLKHTSHDVVLETRMILKERRIGHTGTLDPMAAGVLVLCIGKAAKLVQFLQNQDKEYEAEMTLGVRTDTLDSTGRIISRTECTAARNDVQQALTKFKGAVWQVPPMTSAIKKNGVPLYKLARQGRNVDRQSRIVQISRLELLDFWKDEFPKARILVECSKGTYVRSLVDDIGKSLGCGAHVSKLVRTRVGSLTLSGSVTLDRLKYLAENGRISEILIPMEQAVNFMPFVQIKKSAERSVKNGQPVTSSMVKGHSQVFKKEETLRIMDTEERLLAIGRAEYDIGNRQRRKEEILAKLIRVI